MDFFNFYFLNSTLFQVLVSAQIFPQMPQANSWQLAHMQHTVLTNFIPATANSLKLLIPSQPHNREAGERSRKQPDIFWQLDLSTGHVGDMNKAGFYHVLTACLQPRADICQAMENKSSQELIPFPCGYDKGRLPCWCCDVVTPVALQISGSETLNSSLVSYLSPGLVYSLKV